MVGSGWAHVPNVARDYTFTSHSRDEPVEKEKHGSVVVHDLSNQFLAIFELDQRVDSKLDVLTLADIGQVLAHTYIVQVDLFKQIVETSDDIEVALFETII